MKQISRREWIKRGNIQQHEKGGFSNNLNQVVISQNTSSIDKEISNSMKREDSQIINSSSNTTKY